MAHKRKQLALLVAAAFASGSQSPVATSAILDVWRGAPISFERNDGQFPPDVLFVARGVAGEVRIRSGEVAITPRSSSSPGQSPRPLRMGFARSNLAPEVEPLAPLPSRSHYYLGERRWEDVPHYEKLRFRDVYPDIDLVLHGSQGTLEYDFVVSPGADPANIRLDLSAVDESFVDAQGNLVLRVGSETLYQRAPVAFQADGEARQPIEARFELSSAAREASFALGEFDRARPLVIDPELTYSTFVGSTGSDFGGYLQLDPSGRLYLAYTSGADGLTNQASSGTTQVNVTKIDPVTRAQLFTTTIGGSGVDNVFGLAIGASGAGYASYIAGRTTSSDFPRCFRGDDCGPYGGGDDAFVTAINENGTVVYSRFLGGSGSESAEGIAVDASGSIYVTGTTTSGNFPTTGNALYPSKLGAPGSSKAFVSKLRPGSGLLYSTYFGGSGNDFGGAIAVDASGNMHVAGNAQSFNFPVVNGFGYGTQGAFVAKIGASGGPLLYSGTLGAFGDAARGIALDPTTNQAVIVGDTANPSFPRFGVTFAGLPTAGFSGARDAFVTRIGASGGTLAWSTLLGGSGLDFGGGVAVGSNGDVVVTGQTSSPNFPVVDPYQSSRPGSQAAFVARIRNSPAIAVLDRSTYLGGGATSLGSTIRLGASGTVHVAGATSSSDFPSTANAFRSTRSGSSDVFIATLALDALPPGAPTLTSVSPGNGQVTLYFTPPASNGGAPITSYVVRCNPGGATSAGASSPITVTGLVNGSSYVCTVSAVNSAGEGPASAQSGFVTPRAELAVLPASIDFGGQSMGTRSRAIASTVTNMTGSTISGLAVTSSPQFTQTNNCSPSLPPAGSCTVNAVFAPSPVAGAAVGATTSVSGAIGISSGSSTLGTIALTGTAEKSLVTHYYRSVLRRDPDAGGKQFWTGEATRVVSLGADVNEAWFALAVTFFGSPEYAAFNRDTSGFVTDLYTTFFDRVPDSGGLAFWSSQITAGMPREAALVSFLFSPEFSGFSQALFGSTPVRPEINTVMDFYRGLLRRLPDGGGFNYWLQRFRNAQCLGAAAVTAEAEAVSSAFANSGEYLSLGRTNAQFVADMYDAFMRRGGDLGGTVYWINELNSGARTREQVRREFVASPEFAARVAAIIAQGCLTSPGSVTGTVGSGGGTLAMPGVVSVQFPPGALAGDTSVTLGTTRDSEVASLFDVFAGIFQPAARLSYEIRIRTGASLPLQDTIEVAVTVPDSFVAAVPAQHGIDAFALFDQGGPLEQAYAVFDLIPSTFNPASKTVTLALPAAAFVNNSLTGGNYEAVITLAPTPRPGASSAAAFDSREKVVSATPCSNLQCPLTKCEKTSDYQRSRFNPVSRKYEPHLGVDYRANTGDPVFAPAAGKIELTFELPTTGKLIRIRHTDGSATQFFHLDSFKAQMGQTVSAGQLIAIADNTGRSEAPHLHMEYVRQGQINLSPNRTDPDACINASIVVFDSGSAADDAFEVSVDGVVLGSTTIGGTNTLAISNLTPGVHTLALKVTVAPDDLGTYTVTLNRGLTFTDGTTSKTGDAPQGATVSWQFTAP